MTQRKDPAAVRLGRKGGQQRAKNLTAKERHASAVKASLAAKAWRDANPSQQREIAKRAAKARWLKATRPKR